jgi:hypothetical protein
VIATNGTVTKTTDYIGGMQYEGNTLLMKQTAFGRLRLAGSAVVYEYYIKDHLNPDRSPNSRSANTNRGVAKWNPFGYIYHQASAWYFKEELAPYTGY